MWSVMGDSHSNTVSKVNGTLGFLRRNTKDCTKPATDLTYKAIICSTYFGVFLNHYKLKSQHWSRCRDEWLDMSIVTTIPELQDVSPRCTMIELGATWSQTQAWKTWYAVQNSAQPCRHTHWQVLTSQWEPYQWTSQILPGFQMLHIPTPSFHWNKLPVEIVSAASLEEFKSLLGVICSTTTAHQWQCIKF